MHCSSTSTLSSRRRLSGQAPASRGTFSSGPIVRSNAGSATRSLAFPTEITASASGVASARLWEVPSTPANSSFAIQALVVKHFLHGGYYPVGGSARIAEALLQTVADAGGATRICADVEEILVVGGKATGVRLASGEVIHAPRVISAAGVLSTVNRLLPERYRDDPWIRELKPLRSASAHVCLYLGFKGDIREAGASGANK